MCTRGLSAPETAAEAPEVLFATDPRVRVGTSEEHEAWLDAREHETTEGTRTSPGSPGTLCRP